MNYHYYDFGIHYYVHLNLFFIKLLEFALFQLIISLFLLCVNQLDYIDLIMIELLIVFSLIIRFFIYCITVLNLSIFNLILTFSYLLHQCLTI